MKVVGHENGMYRVRYLYNNTESDIHISRLTKFIYDKARLDPESGGCQTWGEIGNLLENFSSKFQIITYYNLLI
jgi:hypothetical protein